MNQIDRDTILARHRAQERILRREGAHEYNVECPRCAGFGVIDTRDGGSVPCGCNRGRIIMLRRAPPQGDT